jgi:succinate dehydrogenase/fumarate reductase flavoprotein subunit
VRKFDTIEELAFANQAPLLPLKATIETYNALIEKGRDDRFGKPIPKDLLPMNHPPYYAIRLISKVHHCMGGIRINPKAQVLRIDTGQPMGRFYAAGEIVGGVHGASRLGSNAIPECLVFGRIAGSNASCEPPRS